MTLLLRGRPGGGLYERATAGLERWSRGGSVATRPPEVEQSAAERGVEFYLPKPFLLQDLEEIVQTVLAVWQTQEQEA